MKKTSLYKLAGSVLLILVVIQTGCTGDRPAPEEADVTQPEAVAAQQIPPSFVYVQHGVKDFDAWLAVYDGFDDQRDSAGVVEMWVHRDLDKPNVVHVLHGAADVATLRGFTQMKSLATAMKKAGVTGEPRFDFMNIDMQTVPESPIDSQYNVLIKHEIAAWDAWKSAFDAHATTSAAAGLRSRGVARDATNPNIVYINFAASDLAAARKFAASEDLKQTMQGAGVVGAPEIYFTETVRPM